MIDPANQATSHTVNALGDVSQTASADTGVTNRSYDEAGNLKTETDARGVTVSYTYDALNRPTQKQSSQSGSPAYTYGYDSCGKNRLCWIQSNGTFHLYFNYDLHGRLTYQLRAIPGDNWYYSKHLFDQHGRPSQIVYPSGRNVTTLYDPQGRISQINTQRNANASVTVLARDFVYGYPFAAPQSFSYGNEHSSYQSRDQDYRTFISVDGPRIKIAYYDETGNLKSLNSISNSALNYTYDPTGRLTSAIDSAAGGFGSLGYLYDQNGNRQTETRNAGTMPYVYSPPGSNWLFYKGSELRSKTPTGNTASISGVASFTYDGFNRLATSTTAAETTTYTYNALGQRMKKRNQNGLQTVFHYGQNGELLYERDQAGNTKEYVWLDQRPLARIDNGVNLYYYHVDHLGTPQAMTNAAGAVVWKADYEPFGKATIKVSTIENNLRLPGQYFDRETGLHQNYFRDYDPTTGRYISADPIGIAGGLNVYEYANSNPLKYTDPLGLMGGGGAAHAVPPVPGVFGCLVGCVSYSQGDSEPQASLEPTIGGGIQICEKPKPRKPENQCDRNYKPKNCSFYDPNCDNKVQPPGLPVKPDKLGFVVGVSIKRDGRICYQFGLFGSLPLPSVELGGLWSE